MIYAMIGRRGLDGGLMKAVATAYLAAIVLVLSGCSAPVMTHDVESGAKPWTHLEFRNDPQAFQFVIVSDRTGAHRPGVFPKAAKKLNLLQPEFVISVGDLVEGYTEDEAELDKQYEEFDSFVKAFDMPFFYIAGNHDISNVAMARYWEERYGRRYYSFVYNNVLFLCMDSQDGARQEGQSEAQTGLSDRQLEWARFTLDKYPNVRWTWIFIHQPLWFYEEGDMENSGKSAGAGFPELEEALQDRPYTVIAGDAHRYMKCVRKDRRYFILATTGGLSNLRGPTFGEFDHGVWVTMTPDGPKLANLLIDGIHDEDVYTEDDAIFAAGLKFAEATWNPAAHALDFSLPVKNLFQDELHCRLTWEASKTWSISPEVIDEVVPPGEEKAFHFQAKCKDTSLPLPSCTVEFTAGHELQRRIGLAITDQYLQANRTTSAAKHAAVAPIIDGNLDDAIWNRPPDAREFWTLDFQTPSVVTEGWLAYDKTHFYIAVRCEEPRMDKLTETTTERDGDAWADDAVEIFIDTNADRKTYYHAAVNPKGAVYDSLFRDKSLGANIKAATTKKAQAWILEVAIPWKDIGEATPSADSVMGLLLVRHRPHTAEYMQYPPVNGGNHRPQNFGNLKFEE